MVKVALDVLALNHTIERRVLIVDVGNKGITRLRVAETWAYTVLDATAVGHRRELRIGRQSRDIKVRAVEWICRIYSVGYICRLLDILILVVKAILHTYLRILSHWLGIGEVGVDIGLALGCKCRDVAQLRNITLGAERREAIGLRAWRITYSVAAINGDSTARLTELYAVLQELREA